MSYENWKRNLKEEVYDKTERYAERDVGDYEGFYYLAKSTQFSEVFECVLFRAQKTFEKKKKSVIKTHS